MNHLETPPAVLRPELTEFEKRLLLSHSIKGHHSCLAVVKIESLPMHLCGQQPWLESVVHISITFNKYGTSHHIHNIHNVLLYEWKFELLPFL